MKTIATTALVTALTLAGIGSAFAEHPRRGMPPTARHDVARVVDVEPMFAQRPGRIVQECWNERVGRYESGYYRDDRGKLYRDNDGDDGTAGAVIGALVGGALGNQVGDGRGRTAATVAGAVVGAKVGKDIDERDGRYDRDYDDDDFDHYRDTRGQEVRCRTVQTAGRMRARGYRVTYVYGGQTYETYLREHPGRALPVVVDIRPEREYVADYRDWRD
jgi:uncharacterized protein YcfJ